MANDIKKPSEHIDFRPEEFKAYYENRIIPSLKKNFFYAAIYQLLIGAILLALPWALLSALDGMEIMYPIISIPTIPIYQGFGYYIMILSIIQIIYGIILKPKHTESNFMLLFGQIIGAGMIIVPPTGTYVGLLNLLEINTLKKLNKEKYESSRKLHPLSATNVSKSLIFSGLVMMHQPLLILFMQSWVITLPIDMAYPAMAASATSAWAVAGWVIFGGLCLQIVVGTIFSKLPSRIQKISGYGFAVFMMLSFSIFLQTLVSAHVPLLGLDGVVVFATYLVWIIAILLNPLGIHFYKQIKQEMQALGA